MARYLVDTNLLLRILGPDSEQRRQAITAITSLRSQGDILYTTPQIVIEFWSVATRPADANGFGWDAAVVSSEVGNMLQRFPLLEDTPAIFANWLDIVQSLRVEGKRSHDARLVAVMQAHGVDHLLTFNTSDFAVHQGITVVHPADVS